MPDERPLYEEVLDYVLYAPVGVAVQVAKALPDLVETGRKRLGSTLGTARVLGEFTVGTARRRIEKVLDARFNADDGTTPGATVIDSPAVVRSAPATTVEEATLAIPGYDSLAASQVVACLAGLTNSERDRVRAYESAKRARRTILARITQLDEERNAGS